MMRLLERYGQKLESTRTSHEMKIDELKNLINGLSFQQHSLLWKLQLPVGESSATIVTQCTQNHDLFPNSCYNCRDHCPPYKAYKPRHDFPSFDGNDVYKWFCKCNHYFEIEKVQEVDKLKLATYYLNGRALYWHQNFMRCIENQGVTWG